MPQVPQRPFVPHRTPKTARPTITASEFRLYRPFLPGAQRGAVDSIAPIAATGAPQGQPGLNASFRSIADFLDTSAPPTAEYKPERSDSSYASESVDEPNELPPVEHFLDTFPVVEHFAPDAEGALSDAWPDVGGEVAPAVAETTGQPESGWVETDWQQYDWRAAAALGESAEKEASSAWASTDWDGSAPRPRDLRPTAAHAIATALDEIAQRIREGKLAVPGRGPTTDPATIAATLAALLGVRR